MKTAIAKWGNSLALRLPRHIAAEAKLAEGAPVELHVEDGRLVVTATRKKYRLADLLAEMKPSHREQETDWGKPQGEETW